MILFLILGVLLIVGLDQLSKWLVVLFLKGGDPFQVIPGVLQFTYVENRGAAFGMLGEQRWIFMILAPLAILALIYYYWKYKPESKLCTVSIVFLVGGGIGNMIDRIFLGYVIDFIDVCILPEIWMWVFNVADAFVTVGAFMLMFYLVRSMVLDAKKEKEAQKKETDGAGTDGTSEEGKNGDRV